MLEALITYLLLGCVAGLAAGLLGVGGGLIIVPVLALAFRMQGMDSGNIMHLALGTSLATIVFTAVSSVWAHHRRGAVAWGLVFGLAAGMLPGSLGGAFVADSVSSDMLQRLFALFEFSMGIYMIAGTPAMRTGAAASLRWLELVPVGIGIGGMSAILGIGGGTMTVPYLSWRGRDMHQAVAVSAACGLPIALAGAVGYLLAGLDAASLPPLATGYLYWPALGGVVATSLFFAPLGARLAHALPVRQLKRVFGVLLLVMAVTMLFE